MPYLQTAEENGFGAFLMDDPAAVSAIIAALVVELSVPVFAKVRVFPDLERTVEFVRMLEAAGCSLLTVRIAT